MSDDEIAHLELDDAELSTVFGGSAAQRACAEQAMYEESMMM